MYMWCLEPPAAPEAEEYWLQQPTCKQEGQVSTADQGPACSMGAENWSTALSRL